MKEESHLSDSSVVKAAERLRSTADADTVGERKPKRFRFSFSFKFLERRRADVTFRSVVSVKRL